MFGSSSKTTKSKSAAPAAESYGKVEQWSSADVDRALAQSDSHIVGSQPAGPVVTGPVVTHRVLQPRPQVQVVAPSAPQVVSTEPPVVLPPPVVTTGPVVTQFEVEPAPGVKVARIASLDADLTDQTVTYLSKPTNSSAAGLVAYTMGKVEITGEAISKATAVFQTGSSSQLAQQVGWQINFQLNHKGAAKFGEVTTRLVGQQLAIILDRQVESAPTGGPGRSKRRRSRHERRRLT